MFHHSNGKRMNITYTDGGLINSVDILGENEEIESTRYLVIPFNFMVYKAFPCNITVTVSIHMMTLEAY